MSARPKGESPAAEVAGLGERDVDRHMGVVMVRVVPRLALGSARAARAARTVHLVEPRKGKGVVEVAHAGEPTQQRLQPLDELEREGL